MSGPRSAVSPVTRESANKGVEQMRAAIARTFLCLMLITSVGLALSACRHTVSGAGQDIHGDKK
jgi:predicted small secreted protein